MVGGHVSDGDVVGTVPRVVHSRHRRERRCGQAARAVPSIAMARLNRHDLPDYGAYHLTMRGVDGCDIYRDDEDRTHFLRLLGLGTRLAEWRLLAYCLMRNHFHLVVLGELERISR